MKNAALPLTLAIVALATPASARVWTDRCTPRSGKPYVVTFDAGQGTVSVARGGRPAPMRVTGTHMSTSSVVVQYVDPRAPGTEYSASFNEPGRAPEANEATPASDDVSWSGASEGADDCAPTSGGAPTKKRRDDR